MRLEQMRPDGSGKSEAFFAVASSAGIDRTLVEELKVVLAKSGAKTVRACLHDSARAALHDMVVVAKRESYPRPHKHAKKPEVYHLIEGEAVLFVFDDSGNATAAEHLRLTGQFLFRMAANTYHTLVPLSEILVYHEVREGPFEAATESIFPEWAPDGAGLDAGMQYIAELLKTVSQGIATTENGNARRGSPPR